MLYQTCINLYSCPEHKMCSCPDDILKNVGDLTVDFDRRGKKKDVSVDQQFFAYTHSSKYILCSVQEYKLIQVQHDNE